MTDIAQAGDRPSKFTRNYTFFVLVLIYASSHVDRQIVSILAESIKQDLLLSDTQLGFLIGLSFALFYATLGIPIAILAVLFAAQHHRRRGYYLVGHDGPQRSGGQFHPACAGAHRRRHGEAGSSPPSHSMITDMFTLEERQRRWQNI